VFVDAGDFAALTAECPDAFADQLIEPCADGLVHDAAFDSRAFGNEDACSRGVGEKEREERP
jgi:hypothetical protein